MRRNRQHIGQYLLVQRDQHMNGGFVATAYRRRRIAGDDGVLAKILQDDVTVGEIGGIDRGCREPLVVERARDRHERFDVLGEMRDGAVGLAVLDDGTVGAARRVHQDEALAAQRQAFVAAARCIARHVFALCRAITGFFEETPRRNHSFERRSALAAAGQGDLAVVVAAFG